jgi:hypothetical protein
MGIDTMGMMHNGNDIMGMFHNEYGWNGNVTDAMTHYVMVLIKVNNANGYDGNWNGYNGKDA